jgi:hypothetical protein
MKAAQLVGLDSAEMVWYDSAPALLAQGYRQAATRQAPVLIHRDLHQPVTQLQQAAAEAGFALGIASGYRDFSRQLSIMQQKSLGERALLDRFGICVSLQTLTPTEFLAVYLMWSALPGASRHHWGCDIDVFDWGALAPAARLQLTQAEVEGIFAPFYTWLERYLQRDADWRRPYARALGSQAPDWLNAASGVRLSSQIGAGIGPEPWHLSYAPLAFRYECETHAEALCALWDNPDLPLQAQVRPLISCLYRDYVAAYYIG